MPRSSLLAAVAAAAVFAFASISSDALASGAKGDAGARVSGSYAGVNPLGSPVYTFDFSSDYQFTAGTASGQADKVFADTRSVAGGGSATLDLAGSLLDPFGVVVSFGHVNVVMVKADPANTVDVCFGGAPSNAFTGPLKDPTDISCVKPGGVLLWVNPGAGWTVTPGTGDLLQVSNFGVAAGAYSILIVGKST